MTVDDEIVAEVRAEVAVPQEEENNEVAHTTSSKKKKRKAKKKTPTVSACAWKESDLKPQSMRMLGGYTNYYIKYGQTDVPSIKVSDLFSSGEYPVGELQSHGVTKAPNHSTRYLTASQAESAFDCRDEVMDSDNAPRVSYAEARERDRLLNVDMLPKLRHAAEVQRQVRAYGQEIIRPGIVLADMCERLENMNRQLVGENGLQAGIAFPTGCSINHIAAHYSPNSGDTTTLNYGDVMKIDFGTQIDGYIVDTAWTVAFDPQFDDLLMATKEATNAGVRAAGIDVQMCELGDIIQEVMESYEVTINGTTYPVKSIRGLCGHSIAPYVIHGGKSVPGTRNSGDTARMEEGELYAIETFGSTGKGYVIEDGECSHYMLDGHAGHVPLRMSSAKKLLNHITKTFGTLAFCRRWLDRPDGGSFTINGNSGKQEKYLGALKHLVDVGLVSACPPLVDIKGCYTSQSEHCFVLRPLCKEVLSRGEDY